MGDNENGSIAIDASLKKLDYADEPKTKLNGQSTDGGGGVTRLGLARELNTLDRIAALLHYLCSTCTLHAINRIMQTPCEKFFGDGGLSRRNLVQCLCQC